MGTEHPEASDLDGARAEVRRLTDELDQLHRRSRDASKRVRTLEERLLETKGQLAKAEAKNERLTYTLREMRESVAALREEVDKLVQPPASYALVLGVNDDETVDVNLAGRKLRVRAPSDLLDQLEPGSEVALNESNNIVLTTGYPGVGEVVTVKEVLDDHRAVIAGRVDEDLVVELSEALATTDLRAGDTALLDPRASVLLERLQRPEVESLTLEESPDVGYEDIGGLEAEIEQIVDAIELPLSHPDLFADYDLPAPKGVLLYGPPGCGKTMIAKAVASSLARRQEVRTGERTRSNFFNIKGPELLNKYVGETERQIRLIFQRAREKATEGAPVIVFFDEMESLFRTRGSGVSSDVESTIVPQLLAEIDGVEALRNVIVIGASNREDLIDPAILRPGRLDVKIKIGRPDESSAGLIFDRYLTERTPLAPSAVRSLGGGDPEKARRAMIEAAVARMYATDERNRFLEVHYQNGEQEILYFGDFVSGAMIENVVRRSKRLAIKRELADGERGLVADDLVDAVAEEFRQHEDLPNTTNPDDWAKISGKKGERIVYVRTLIDDGAGGGRSIDQVATGQYL